jgi:hypothetical protein
LAELRSGVEGYGHVVSAPFVREPIGENILGSLIAFGGGKYSHVLRGVVDSSTSTPTALRWRRKCG